MRHFGFTGTQHGMTVAQATTVVRVMMQNHLILNDEVWWHHGMCIGSDFQSHNLAKIFGFKCVGHPPTISTKVAEFHDLDKIEAPLDYLSRNHKIVDAVSSLIATPKEYNMITRSGTWATVRYAVKKGLNPIVINPAGNIESYT